MKTKVKIQKIRKHKIELSFDGKCYSLYDPVTHSFEYESTPERLIKEYLSGLETLVLAYGVADDSTLTEDAIEFKKRINRYVRYDLY